MLDQILNEIILQNSRSKDQQTRGNPQPAELKETLTGVPQIERKVFPVEIQKCRKEVNKSEY